MDEEAREQRRDTFARCAPEYADVRPGYPDAALDAVVELAELSPGDPVLEVGCGTGQVTAALTERGLRVTALDRSAEMVTLAAEGLAGSGATVVHDDFEKLAPAPTYAALVCATSYHWLDPESRARRCAGHLRSGGALVLLWHTHPPPFTGFFERVQAIYERNVPDWAPPPSPGMAEERIRGIVTELERSGAYERPKRRGFDWSREYERPAYQRLLATYSDHQLLPQDTRAALIREIGALIDADFGGRVERPYRTELVVARKGGNLSPGSRG